MNFNNHNKQYEDRDSDRFKIQERSFYGECKMYNTFINEAKDKLAKKEELDQWEIEYYEQQLYESEKGKRELIDDWKEKHGQYDERIDEVWEFINNNRKQTRQDILWENKSTYEAKRDHIKYLIEQTYDAEKFENKEQAHYWECRRQQWEDQLEKLELGEEQSLEEEMEMGM